MRFVCGVAAAGAAAALYATSHAAAGPKSPAAQEPRHLLFAGTDMWRHGSFSYGGLMWSPRGVDREGIVLRFLAGGGAYLFRSDALGGYTVTGIHAMGSVMPGWRFVRGTTHLTVMAGLDVQHHRLIPDDPTAGLRGRYTGVRTALELWHEPTPGTMLSADASVSSIGPGYSARAAFGWRLFKRFYLGPDAQMFATGSNHRQIRAGLHVTALRAGAYEWSAGIGFARDSDHRSGTYGRIGLLTRRCPAAVSRGSAGTG